MIGKIISHYRIVDKLGEGGMGAVYKAEDTTLNRFVAIKALSGQLAEHEEARERFVREAQAASALNHPNITTVHDLLEEDDQHFICMEYVDGKTIREMAESGPVLVETSIDIILQAAEALEAAHNKGILHRDVKSANIMVTTEGRVKVMDFGLAHLEERSQLTRTGTTMGTLAYSSPEQIMGNPVDKRSEVFSLGVVFYELLTGQLPFKGSSEAEIVYAIGNIQPDPLSVHREDEPNLPEAIVARMLERDPALRYQDCSELIEDLRIIQAELETPTAQIPRWAREVKAKGRRAATLRFVAAVAAVAVVTVAITLITRQGSTLDPKRVIIAIFENETGDTEFDPLGKIVSNILARGLQQTRLVEVIDPGVVLSSLQMDQSGSGYAASTQALAEKIGAGTIVSGAYYLQGDSLQFHARVTDTRTGKLLQTHEPVSGSVANRLEGANLLQPLVMAAIAALFSEDLAPLAQEMSQPTNYEAYRAYITGVERNSQGDFAVAFGHFLRAMALDSTFVTAALYATVAYYNAGQWAKADSLVSLLSRSRERLTEVERHVLDFLLAHLRGDHAGAFQAVRKANELAPTSPDFAWLAGTRARNINHPREAVDFLTSVDPRQGFLRTWFLYWTCLTEAYHMLEEHNRELKAARLARQQFPDVLVTVAYELRALGAMGRVKKIVRLLDESLTLPPQTDLQPISLRPYTSHGDLPRVAAVELRAHGYREEAQQLFQRAVDWYRDLPQQEAVDQSMRLMYGYALFDAELWDEAEEIFKGLTEEAPDDLEYQGYLGVIAARQGHRDEALWISEQLAAIDRPYLRGANTRWRAHIAAVLGDKEQAVRLLRDALAQGVEFGTWIHSHIDFESLRDYPPFQELLRPKG